MYMKCLYLLYTNKEYPEFVFNVTYQYVANSNLLFFKKIRQFNLLIIYEKEDAER